MPFLHALRALLSGPQPRLCLFTLIHADFADAHVIKSVSRCDIDSKGIEKALFDIVNDSALIVAVNLNNLAPLALDLCFDGVIAHSLGLRTSP